MSRRCILCVFLTVFAVAAVPATGEAQPAEPRASATQQNILFLAIDDFTRPYMRHFFEGFADAVATAPAPAALFFESLDASRFEQKAYLDNLREWLRRKYTDRRVDLIIAIGDDALEFLAMSGGEPWPGVQVLFFENGSTDVDTRTRLPQAGGLLVQDHFSPNLEVLKTVLPGTSHLALVYGASAIERVRWSGYAARAKDAGLEPIELVGASMDELRVALGRLPPQTAALVLGPIVDAGGHVMSPVQLCEMIASARIVPTLSFELNNLGCGAIGGLLRDWNVVGRLLGREALARLARPSNEVVTVPVAKFATHIFDDRQLQIWQIPEHRLPSGAIVRFREPSLWRDYRALVIGVAGVTIVQSLLIAGLVFEHRRRRRAEIESRRHLVAMAHLDRRAAMGELATSLAHELSQPLNAILQNAGVAQMLLTSTAVPQALGEMTDIIGDIRKDDIRASEMIRRMRGLLQKRELEACPVDLNDVAHDTVAIVRPDARSREIELEVQLADGLPAIAGDRVHLQQVLLNLLMNAMDAVAAKPAERRRVRVLTDQKDGEARLAVEDTGRGIPGDRLAEIFEPFYTTKSEAQGMGMGLAIARNIVEAHGGRMGADNNASGGATVWFSVPILKQ
jgi:signal transduction histidine kinase